MKTNTLEKLEKREAPSLEQLAYSINQTARLTSLSRSSIILEIQAGKLPHIKRRGRILILARDLKSYLHEEQSNEN